MIRRPPQGVGLRDLGAVPSPELPRRGQNLNIRRLANMQQLTTLQWIWCGPRGRGPGAAYSRARGRCHMSVWLWGRAGPDCTMQLASGRSARAADGGHPRTSGAGNKGRAATARGGWGEQLWLGHIVGTRLPVRMARRGDAAQGAHQVWGMQVYMAEPAVGQRYASGGTSHPAGSGGCGWR